MPTVHIHLQDGFSNDVVVVRVDGREVYRAEDVTTSMLLGFADTVTADLAGARAVVEVGIPSRDMEARIPVDLRGDEAWLAVSLSPDGIAHHVSHEPFGYA